jgi:hypothetical protein
MPLRQSSQSILVVPRFVPARLGVSFCTVLFEGVGAFFAVFTAAHRRSFRYRRESILPRQVIDPPAQGDALWKLVGMHDNVPAADVSHVLKPEIDLTRPVIDRDFHSLHNADVSAAEIEAATVVTFVEEVTRVLRP